MVTRMPTIDRPTRRILADPDKRRAWCIYQLSLRGSSLAAVARGAGVSRQTLYVVFWRPYPRMEKIVADALGMRPQELFPERYDADGLPNRKIGRPFRKSTAKTAGRNGKSREAA